MIFIIDLADHPSREFEYSPSCTCFQKLEEFRPNFDSSCREICPNTTGVVAFSMSDGLYHPPPLSSFLTPPSDQSAGLSDEGGKPLSNDRDSFYILLGQF